MKLAEGHSEQDWQDWKANNADPYGAAVMAYAERWAEMMEAELEGGAILEDIAERTSHEADLEGITGFQYGAAVATLAKAWAYGDRLRRWHNLETQIGDEGERANEEGGTLNPALLNVTVKE